MFIFRCKGINISSSKQIFGQINACSLHILSLSVHEKGENGRKLSFKLVGKGVFFDMILLGWATDFCNFAHMILFSLSSGEMNRS